MNNWSIELEDLLNKQINTELNASHTYLYLSTLFSHDSVGYPNIGEFLKKESREETKHATIFIDYQIMRGGHVVLGDLHNPIFELLDNGESNLLQLFRYILKMEQSVYESIINISNNNTDNGLQTLLDDFIKEQLDSQYKLGIIIKQLELIGNNPSNLYDFYRSFNI